MTHASWHLPRRQLLTSLVASVLALAACTPAATPAAPAATAKPAASGGQAGAAAAKTTHPPLRLSMGHKVLFDVAAFDAVAQKKGFYDQEGLRFGERVYPAGSGDAVQALVSDSADLAIGVAFFAVFSGVQQGAPIKIVSAEHQGYRDIAFYVPSESPAKSISDLAGLNIASSRPGSTTDMLTRELQAQLKREGKAEPKLTPLGSPPEVFTATRTKQVDVGWTVPPFFFDEAEKGTIRMVASGDDLARYKGTTARVNLASDKVLRENPETVKAFFRAYQRAIDWTYQNKEEAAAIWKEAAKLEQSVPTLVKAMETYPKENMELKSINGLDKVLGAAVELGFLKQPLAEADVRKAMVLDQVLP